MTTIPTADQALLRMFALLMANDDTVPVAESLRALTEDMVPVGQPARTGDMMAIVYRLRVAHPEHADHILVLATSL